MAHTLNLVKVEDHEGDGRCGECGREGLRWIARLSDGSGVGLECSKKLLGYRPGPKTYDWVAHFLPVAEYHDYGNTYVLWRHKTGKETRETLNGHLVAVGGCAQEWVERGWLPAAEHA